MTSRRLTRSLRTRAGLAATLALLGAALALPGAASALATPAITSPTDGAVLGSGDRAITFTMADTSDVVSYELLRAAPTAGACDMVPPLSSVVKDTSTDPAAVELDDTSTLTGGDWCYWVEADDALADATYSAPVMVTYMLSIVRGSEPASPTQSTSASFSFSSTTGTLQCKLNGVVQSTCTSPESFAGLADNTYTFRVQVTDGGSNVGFDSYTWTVDTTPPVVSITSGPASLTSSTSASLAFSDGGFTPTCQLDSATVACTTSSTMSLSGLADGPHTFDVHSTDAAGNVGSDSYGWTVDSTPPSVPTNVRAAGSPTRSSPVISWNASTNAPSTYEVLRDGVPIGSVNAPATGYSDMALPLDGTADGDYLYTIVAVDALGNESAASTPVQVVLDTTGPTPSPSLSAPSPTALRPSLHWPASTASDLAGYNVYRGTTRLNTSLVTGTSFTDVSLVGDGTYTYIVRTVDTAGNESAASTATNVVYDTTAPSAPQATVVAAPAGSTATLSWVAASDAGSGVGSYEVRRSAPNGAAPGTPADGTPVCGTLAAAALGCTDSGLTPGAGYRYSVFAIDAVGNVSGAGQTLAITIPVAIDRTPPKAPTKLHAAISTTKVSLSWKNPKTDLANVMVVWNATRAPRSASDGTTVYRGSGTHATVELKKLPTGKHVRFAVFALDTTGNASKAARASVAVPLPSPVSLAPGGKLSGSPSLSWTSVGGATYYNVQVFAGTQATTRVGIAWPGGTRWTLPGSVLQKGKTYTWYVWPGLGAKADAKYGKLIGKVTFTYEG